MKKKDVAESGVANFDDLEQIRVTCEEGIAWVRLNRPKRLNAWTRQMEVELRRAITTLANAEDVAAIGITGEGKGFCSGADLDWLSEGARGRDIWSDVEKTSGSNAKHSDRFGYLLNIPKLVVAAINGVAAGVGLSFALYADIRYIRADARLTTVFSRRGLIAEHGAAWMLPRLVGAGRAMELLVSGRAITGDEAARMGLGTVMDCDGFDDRVRERVRELVRGCSPRSVGIIKRQVYMSLEQNLEDAWKLSDLEARESLQSDDFKEGIRAFVEERTLRFDKL